MTLPFADVDRSTQLRRLRVTARRVLDDYRLTDPRLRLVNHDFNTTYRVDATEGRFALRLNVNSKHDADAVAAEAAWVSALAAEPSLRVPAPRRTGDGRLSTRATVDGLPGERGAVLYEWLPGPDLGPRASLARLRALGRATASLHDHTERWTHPEPGHRPGIAAVLMDDPERISSDRRITGNDRATLIEATTALEEILAPVFDAPTLLIHGDLHVWNTKWVDGRLAVFDFDDCGFGVALQDLAISAYYVRDRPGADEAILTGYAEHRPLPHDVSGASRPLFEALIASRNVLLLNSVLDEVTAGRSDFLVGYVERTARRLRGWLDTGRFELLA